MYLFIKTSDRKEGPSFGDAIREGQCWRAFYIMPLEFLIALLRNYREKEHTRVAIDSIRILDETDGFQGLPGRQPFPTSSRGNLYPGGNF